MTTPSAKPGVMLIKPYVAGGSNLEGRDDIIKLSSNEGAFGPSPKAQAAYTKGAAELHRYPDGGSTELRETIGKVHGLNADQIVCGAGSDELIALLCSSYASEGDEVLYSQYGFLMYPISAMAAGATPVTAPETDLTANVDALLAAVTDRTRILFLANPNNPTGTSLPASEVKRLHDNLRDDVLLVIDAAYAEYIAHEDYTAGIELVDAGDNVIMTRTFSKIYGLGGARLGWAYGPANVIDVLNRARGPFNVNSAALDAGVAAIQDKKFTEKCVAHNLKWLAWTRDELRELGLTVTDSAGNFLLVEFDGTSQRNASAADKYLQGKGIIVRSVASYGLPNHLRITIGLEEEMRRVIDALRHFLGKNSD
ncbi:MAG: histidinol-phosphate transaminase [Rhodospirillales bacterium]|jgi:histidinol-phosphate aminotransferase|tara:strand:- start:3253 stop:4353 length:1101 start_codon:yes stop_codon:yes gene_type:complete